MNLESRTSAFLVCKRYPTSFFFAQLRELAQKGLCKEISQTASSGHLHSSCFCARSAKFLAGLVFMSSRGFWHVYRLIQVCFENLVGIVQCDCSLSKAR